MSTKGLQAACEKMQAAQVSQQAIEVFKHYYHLVEQGAEGVIREADIEPLTDPVYLKDVEISDDEAQAALAKTVIVKINGGLGTSMGMDKAKSLLMVRDGLSFLDIIARQVLHVREKYNVKLPLIFMNSFRTQTDTLEIISKYSQLPVDGLPIDFLQNQEPKLLADTLEPVSWPANPQLEWCPPGHGDLFTAILGTGILDMLLAKGYRYMCTSNADNLGSFPSPKIAGWFARSGAPYAAEICVRTINDRKGGHVAIRKADRRVILRDTAQTAPEEMDYFTDEHLHKFFHTNNLWFDLQIIKERLADNPVIGLPLIKNLKTVDPTDESSPKVIQIETGMGTAIECFTGAQCICVERERFLPVKTTNELLLLRSDLYELTNAYHLRLVTSTTPLVELDSKVYKTISNFEAHFPAGIPSMREVNELVIKGDWTIYPSAKWSGKVHIIPPTSGGSGEIK